MDDTILSYEQGVDTHVCWLQALDCHWTEACEFSREELLFHIQALGKVYWSDPVRHRTGRMDLVKARQEIIASALLKFNMDDLQMAGNIASTYEEERDKAIALFPDSIQTIGQLRDKGIKLALLTNGSSEAQWKKIRRFELAPWFDCVLVEGEFGIGKPDDRIYLHALERLEAAPENTWMIGDNFEWEVAAPQRLGIKGIWIDHKGQGAPPNAQTRPYKIIRSLSEILQEL